MKHRENLLLLGFGVLLFIIGGIIMGLPETPECLKNTDDVIAWAEANGIQVNCAAGCDFAVNEYLKAHNLTPEEFPTCCWAVEEVLLTPEEKVGAFLVLFGTMMILVEGGYLVVDKLKKVLRNEA